MDWNIWLNRFDPSKKNLEFERFSHGLSDKTSILNNEIYCTLKDKKGILWIGTQTGLDYFDTQSKKFVHSKNLPVLPGKPGPAVFSLAQTSSGEIWIGTYSYGFYI